MQSNDIIAVLSNDKAIRFIQDNMGEDIPSLSLKYAGKTSFNLSVALQLMSIYKKANRKLPLFVSLLLALDLRSYEQATSQRIAQYKATFIQGKKMLDITAGLGIDSLFLAPQFNDVEAVERNESLHEFACFNLKKLGVSNIQRVHANGLDILTQRKVDWLYVDPDRRSDEKRAVPLELLEPNVLTILPAIKKAAAKAYVKLSPMFDLVEITRKFEKVSDIYVLAEKNEVKEVGVVLDWAFEGDLQLHLVDVSGDFEAHFSFDEYRSKQKIHYPKGYHTYLHIPLALVSKSSCYEYFTSGKSVLKHADYQLFFSDQSTLYGFRTFKVLNRETLATKKIKKVFRELNILQVNIIVKGMDESPHYWHKKWGTRDGGDYYIFLLKSANSEAILCKRII